MREETPRGSLFRNLLMLMLVALMIGMFSGSTVCLLLAYRTWRGSAVKVHCGLDAVQHRYTQLSGDERERLTILLAGAGGGAVVGFGSVAGLKRLAARRP